VLSDIVKRLRGDLDLLSSPQLHALGEAAAAEIERLRGVAVRRCLRCGQSFQVGVGTGRRLDAKFCSEAHKIVFHSLARAERAARKGLTDGRLPT
jgi:hypothetical protein